MTTRATIEGYFDHLKQMKGWDSFLAEDLAFTSFTSPTKEAKGKEAYLQSTKRFFSMVTSVELRDLMVEGEKACALTRYELRPPAGKPFACDVAEVFTVQDGKIKSFAIYFDSAPLSQVGRTDVAPNQSLHLTGGA
jgi:ketosteroid isomerase-like protein